MLPQTYMPTYNTLDTISDMRAAVRIELKPHGDTGCVLSVMIMRSSCCFTSSESYTML